MRTPTRTRMLALACAGLVLATATGPAALAATGAPASHAVTIDDRGTIVSADLLARLSAGQIAAYLTEAKFPVPDRPQGADLYAVVYRTTAVDGTPTTASGVVALPHRSRHGLWTVSYQHGTLATKAGAGSVSDGDGRAAPLMFAAAGFAGVAPDYLGLGKGPGFHPYMDAATEASASLDLLRAAGELAAGKGRSLSGDVLLTGFSQGGHATMALGKELRDERGLRLRGVAPIAGPYDVKDAELPALLGGRLDPGSATFYLAYWTVSMNRLHHFYDSPSEVFQDPGVERLFDGLHNFDEIVAGLPASPQDLVTPAYLKSVSQPSGPLLRALEVNDTTCAGWRPGVPVRLYAGRGDRDVAIANSYHCLRDLRASKVKVSLTDVGDVDHFTSAKRSLPKVLDWFTALRDARR
ncbi:alpha/beta hydrolase [Nonomuraea turkmeniaca]|uniref:Alpha/beta hydrolase n=1 Tax=Nonomuraea turkmeniaca TaxID=103838 RepID=A0A5S4FVN2_9ACTN|nr:alpha/beta hydrolase [Nonomuraea turkmeniaca]TMR24151.1 alpha/beta hydrolase [Nonomuraea turkmeniaca]